MTMPSRTAGTTLGAGFALFVASVGFLIGRQALGDNSFLTHLATGNLILESGSVPSADPYSFTAPGEPWVVQSWLASVLYALLDQTVGGFGIRVLNGVLGALTAFIVWRLVSRRTTDVFVPLGLTGATLIIGASMWSPRPLLFGLAGVAGGMAVLEGTIKPQWLLPVMWVWVNTHGSFPLAGVLVATVGVGSWLDQRAVPEREVRVLGWVAAGTLLGALNPLGPRLLWFPVELLTRREALDNVVEWRAFQLDGVTAWVFVGLVTGFVAAMVSGAPWRVIVPGSVFVLAALLAVRNIPTAAIVLAVMSAPYLRLERGQLRLDDVGILSRVLTVGSGALVALALVAVTISGPLDLDGYPVDELDALAAAGFFDGEHRLVHPEVVGNYLTVRYGTEASVFVDDRFDFYPQAVIDDLETLLYGGDYAAVVERYEPDAVLWKTGGGFEAWLRARSDWTVADPLDIEPADGGPAEPSDWFLAWPAVDAPSPEILAANP